jgi:hypothetical protein
MKRLIYVILTISIFSCKNESLDGIYCNKIGEKLHLKKNETYYLYYSKTLIHKGKWKSSSDNSLIFYHFWNCKEGSLCHKEVDIKNGKIWFSEDEEFLNFEKCY